MNAIGTPSGRGHRRPLASIYALAVASAIACGWLTPPAGAAVYKWVDPQGLTHYTDRPPPPDGKLISIDASYDHFRPDSARATPPARPPANPAGAPQSASDQAQAKQAVASDVASAHSQDCKQAQERYQNYVRSRRLYKEGPNKERVYLNDAELETERVNAKREADEACANAEQR